MKPPALIESEFRALIRSFFEKTIFKFFNKTYSKRLEIILNISTRVIASLIAVKIFDKLQETSIISIITNGFIVLFFIFILNEYIN